MLTLAQVLLVLVVVSERVGQQFAMMTVSSRGAAALPALSLVLLAMSASSPSATAQRFDLSQLSLRAAAEAQAGSSGYFNCPEQVREQNNVNVCGIPLWKTPLSNASPNAREWVINLSPFKRPSRSS